MNESQMKKLLNVFLLITSLFGYLEWGQDQSSFLFQVEADLFVKLTESASSLAHPLILLPLSGQILLLITVFQKTPNRIMTLVGLACLSTIMIVIFIVGCIGGNFKVILSTLPFLICGIFVIRANWKR